MEIIRTSFALILVVMASIGCSDSGAYKPSARIEEAVRGLDDLLTDEGVPVYRNFHVLVSDTEFWWDCKHNKWVTPIALPQSDVAKLNQFSIDDSSGLTFQMQRYGLDGQIESVSQAILSNGEVRIVSFVDYD